MKIVKADSQEDIDFIYNLRYSKSVQEVSISEKIPKDDYIKKLENNYQDINVVFFEGKRAGYLLVTNEGYISLVFDEKFRGKGLGTKVLKEYKPKTKAIILNGNDISLRVFLKGGFKIKGFYLEKE